MNNELPQVPDNEFERLLKLAEYDIDYKEIHGKLDDLAKLASFIANVPIARLNILGANTVWTISNFGLDSRQTERKESICQYSILEDEEVEVKNLTQDDRFKDKEYVTSGPKLRYYFGIPLNTKDDYSIGTLCVMDVKENDITPEKKEFLKIIAKEVITRIEYEKNLKFMKNNVDVLEEIQKKVSHDIRGPIGGIIGIAEILQDQAQEQKLDEFMQLLELINKGGRSVLDLADEILSNYEGPGTDTKTKVNELTLSKLVGKIEDLYQPQAKSKSILLSVDILSDNKNLTFPKYKLMQIFGNLITNAIKFTPENGEVNIALTLTMPPNQFLKFEISDNGLGMSEAKVKEILSDEARSTAGTKNERGYGFGFQLARHLTEKMDGELTIQSEEGQGTNVIVTIPLG